MLAALFVITVVAAGSSAAPTAEMRVTRWSANGALETAQDPLMEQIRLQQLRQPNGGVTAFVRLPSGQAVRIVSLDEPPAMRRIPTSMKAAPVTAIVPLTPNPDLAGRPAKSRQDRAAVRRAHLQLRRLHQDGLRPDWGERR